MSIEGSYYVLGNALPSKAQTIIPRHPLLRAVGSRIGRRETVHLVVVIALLRVADTKHTRPPNYTERSISFPDTNKLLDDVKHCRRQEQDSKVSRSLVSAQQALCA